MITLIWSKNSLLGSRLIRFLTRSDCSHFVIVFSQTKKDRGLVVQSNFFGVGLSWFKDFSEKNKIVHSLEYDLGLEKEDAIFERILDQHFGKKYDWGAFFYMGYRLLLKLFLGLPMPTTNLWAKKEKFECIELSETLGEEITGELPHVAAIDPHQLFIVISKFRESWSERHLRQTESSEGI